MDRRVIFLTGDLGFQVFDDFRKEFPRRYINVGVAEAQLMLAAAGLALEGWRPVAYSIASFATARPFEQIKISICYPRLPVIVVGAGGGYTYSNSGITHQAPDDLGLMSMMPGMTVVAPGCPDELSMLMPQLLDLQGPSYIRIGKFGEPEYFGLESPEIGKFRLLREGVKIAIFSTGDIASVVLNAADRLKADSIFPVVYQAHTIKPLDRVLLDALSDKVHYFVVVEEHLPQGGLYSGICEWYAGRVCGPKLLRLGPPDKMILGSPSREALRHRIGCDELSIVKLCKSLWVL